MAVTERMQNAGYRDFDSFDRNGFVEVMNRLRANDSERSAPFFDRRTWAVSPSASRNENILKKSGSASR